MQTETGDIRSKSFDLFPAVSFPDLFMERLKNDEHWTIFDPYEARKFLGKAIEDTYGDEFRNLYLQIEASDEIKSKKVMKAKDLFKTYLKSTVETGMPYAFFRDTVNRMNPQKHAGMIYCSNLCTEIAQNMATPKFLEEVVE